MYIIEVIPQGKWRLAYRVHITYILILIYYVCGATAVFIIS